MKSAVPIFLGTVKFLTLPLGLLLAGPTATAENPHPMPAITHPRALAAAARVRPTLERDLATAGLHFGAPAYLRAFKQELTLELFIQKPNSHSFQLFRSYPIAASSGTIGPKLTEGDGQVPEGCYSVPPSAMKPDSRYHLAFNLGYPNAYDRAQGRTGSFIMIHGNRVSIGCLAMTDEKIEEIFTLCAAAQAHGQAAFRVDVFPFRMTAANLAAAAGSPWETFWQNLRQGYDAFEKSHIPPEFSVRDGRYIFRSP